jgi:uncharacterized protein YaeQ
VPRTVALKSTIYKATLQVADIDHDHYADHALTLARHPSETDERMMMRLVALALQAYTLNTLCHGDGTLSFGKGLSDPDDPDAMLVDFTGRKRVWIEVGQPDERALTKASSQADFVMVYAYGSAADIWWKAIEPKVSRLNKVQVWRIPAAVAQEVSGLAERSMMLNATIQEGLLTLSSNAGSVSVEPVCWKPGSSQS